MAKLVDLNVQKVAWVTVIGNIAAPTVSELTAGQDLSCMLLPSYNVDFADSETVSERALCETANTVVATVANYEGQLDLFRDYTTSAPATTDPLTVFVPGTFPVGFIVRRIGKPSETPWAAADKVEVYKFQVDSVKSKGGSNEGYLKSSVKLNPQGIFKFNAVVAGP